MRWQIHLSYLGTHYSGWQRQPNAISVQQTLEEAFALILRQPVEVVGCGRTDTGVHARDYVAHTDIKDCELTEKTRYQINAVLPADISIQSISEVSSTFHARFDAIERHYKYYMHFQKNPFLNGVSCEFHQGDLLDQKKVHAAAELILGFNEFLPFCKTGSDAEHFRCALSTSEWTFDQHGGVYSIKANRFLRGMVRLTVGACLNVGLGKISLDVLKASLEQQTPLKHAWSVPAEGLFLEKITYPG